MASLSEPADILFALAKHHWRLRPLLAPLVMAMYGPQRD
jgi:hypothetical protein